MPLHAVPYHLAIERYLTEQGHDYDALVAFSGTVRDGGIEHTETNLNGIPDPRRRRRTRSSGPRTGSSVVANKYQTGFDQPLLHAM